MKRRKNTLAEALQGQHLNLNVAAHLARTQLVADPRARYDSDHLLEMVDVVASALVRVAPVHLQDAAGTRELSAVELEGARVREGLLLLRDGRRLSSVTIKRSELRQAIAILRAVGVPELGPQLAEQRAATAEPVPVDPLARLAELEALLLPPLVPSQVQRATRLAVSFAREAKHGHVANLAMQLVSALHDTRDISEVPGGYRLALARLRAALEDSAHTPP